MSLNECNLCPLAKSRTNVVPGIGPIPCDVMVIGEGPGANEDKIGEPFVGRSGKLLMEWFNSVNLIRGKNYFLTNIVKCRPPNNRNPEYKEMYICGKKWLNGQVIEVSPKLIITVGAVSTKFLLKEERSVTKLVGKIFQLGPYSLFPMFHPAYILRQPKIQKLVDQHLELLGEILTGLKNE